jgi:hypothetical protein
VYSLVQSKENLEGLYSRETFVRGTVWILLFYRNSDSDNVDDFEKMAKQGVSISDGAIFQALRCFLASPPLSPVPIVASWGVGVDNIGSCPCETKDTRREVVVGGGC